MKNRFTKWLSALLIAAMLLTPVAFMEESVEDATDAAAIIEEPAGNAPEADEVAEAPEAADDSPAESEDAPVAAEAAEAVEAEVAAESVDEVVEEAEADELSLIDVPESVELDLDGEASFEASFEASGIAIDATNFPDETFRSFIAANYDENNDGVLSDEEIDSVCYLDFTDKLSGATIETLKGIELFPELVSLSCDNLGLKELDLSQNEGLGYLSCQNNSLTSLNLSKNTELRVLQCSSNALQTLTLGDMPRLYYLDTRINNLTELDVSKCPLLADAVSMPKGTVEEGDRLVKRFGDNEEYIEMIVDDAVALTPATPENRIIATLDATNFPDANFLKFVSQFDGDGDGKLSLYEVAPVKSLEVYKSTYIDGEYYNESLNIKSLKGIEYFYNITYLDCYKNQVETLDLSKNTKLVRAWVNDNKLTSLNVSGCTELVFLGCWNNQLTSLDVTKNTKLVTLDCCNNKLTTIDVSHCPEIVKYIDSKYYSATEDNHAFYDNGGEDGALLCDLNVKIIGGNPVVQASAAPAPAAPAAEPAAPAPAPVPTIAAVKKSGKATLVAAPGTVAQLDLGGAVGKKFKSSKKKVATVDQTGLVTVKKAGKTKITFKVGKKTRAVTLTVKDPTIPTAIYLNLAGTVPAQVGVPQVLTVTLPDGTNSGIKWKSSNKKVATVKNGVVTFKKAGKATITATATRGKKKAKVKFKVSK